MTAPIEVAYAAMGVAIAAALVEAEFISAPEKLEIDPPSAFAPEGDEKELVAAAALVQFGTAPAQTFIGGPLPRYAVERQVRLELGAAGPDGALRKTRLDAAATKIAAAAVSHYQLGSACERMVLTGSDDDDLPPNGSKKILTFTLRVRALDPLGMS